MSSLRGRIEYESFDFDVAKKNQFLYEFTPEDVKHLSRLNYVDLEDVNTSNRTKKEKEYRKSKFFKNLDVDISVSGGAAFRTASVSSSVPSDLRNHISDLNSGYFLELNFSLFFDEMHGLGFHANTFRSSASNFFTQNPPGGNEFTGNVNSNQEINFYGLSYQNRYLLSNQKHQLTSGIGAGYVSYDTTDAYSNENQSFELLKSTNTFGVYASVSYSYQFSKNWFLGAQISFITGRLGDVKVADEFSGRTFDIPDPDSLNRVNLGLLLNYNF